MLSIRADGEQLRRIAMVIYPGVSSVDVCGPLEAFSLANYISGVSYYDIITVSSDGQPVPAAGSWVNLAPTHSFETAPEHLDTIFVAGGPAYSAAAEDEQLLTWLRGRAEKSRRVASVCNGAFILAAAGLAKGSRLATHWLYAGMLTKANPDIDVDPDAIFVEDGKVWSSGGMTSGMDLALAMIEKDVGRPLALEVARLLVLHLKRSGGQSQFSMHLRAQFNDVPSVARIQQWIIDNPAADLRIETIAEQHAMSKRSLARLFSEHTGSTIGDFIAEARLRHACSLLENTQNPFKDVATQSGLGTEANLRKIFASRLGVTPSQYRAKFRGDSQESGKTAHYDEFWLARTDVLKHRKTTAAQ